MASRPLGRVKPTLYYIYLSSIIPYVKGDPQDEINVTSNGFDILQNCRSKREAALRCDDINKKLNSEGLV